jgi:hypothetical protein
LLRKDQKDELREWRAKGGGGGAGSKGKSAKSTPKDKSNAKAIASAVEKKVAETMKSLDKEKAKKGEAEAFIMALFDKHKSGASGTAKISDTVASPSVPAPTLKGILKHVKKYAKNENENN